MAFKRININEAEAIIQYSETVVVDIRDTESYQQGHIDGAVHLTQENLGHFIENTDKEADILVVCYHGNSSQGVAQYLSEYGFQKVYSLDGGYERWVNG